MQACPWAHPACSLALAVDLQGRPDDRTRTDLDRPMMDATRWQSDGRLQRLSLKVCGMRNAPKCKAENLLPVLNVLRMRFMLFGGEFARQSRGWSGAEALKEKKFAF